MTIDKLLSTGSVNELAELLAAHEHAVRSVAVDGRYAGYLAKEQKARRRMRQLDKKLIPETIDYSSVSHLRHEAREHLMRIKPRSLGQALRISGITPADITVLAVFLLRNSSQAE